MQTQVSSVRAGGAVALKDVRTSVRERGEDEAGLTILVPFPVPPPVPLPPVADHGLCSCLVVQAIPAAGSVGAVTEQMGTITALIPFSPFPHRQSQLLVQQPENCSEAEHCKLPRAAGPTPKPPEG